MKTIYELVYDRGSEGCITLHLSFNKQKLQDFINSVEAYDLRIYDELSHDGKDDDEWDEVQERRDDWNLHHPLAEWRDFIIGDESFEQIEHHDEKSWANELNIFERNVI